MNTCKVCRFFQLKMFPGYINTGICKRFPPIQLGEYSLKGAALFPMVYIDSVCGEFKPMNLMRYEKILAIFKKS